jgi:hypothetical protein
MPSKREPLAVRRGSIHRGALEVPRKGEPTHQIDEPATERQRPSSITGAGSRSDDAEMLGPTRPALSACARASPLAR